MWNTCSRVSMIESGAPLHAVNHYQQSVRGRSLTTSYLELATEGQAMWCKPHTQATQQSPLPIHPLFFSQREMAGMSTKESSWCNMLYVYIFIAAVWLCYFTFFFSERLWVGKALLRVVSISSRGKWAFICYVYFRTHSHGFPTQLQAPQKWGCIQPVHPWVCRF